MPTWILAGEEEVGMTVPSLWSGPTSGLVHRWWMDDSHVATTVIQDDIGGNNGTVLGSVTSTSSPSGALYPTARRFIPMAPQNVGCLTLQSHLLLDWNNAAFSWGAWLYLDSNSTIAPGSTNPTFFFDDFSSNGTDFLRVICDLGAGNGALGVSKSGGTDGLVSPAGSLPSATWGHLLYTTTGPSGINALYYNGVGQNASNEGASAGGESGIGIVGTLDPSGTGNITGRMYNMVIYNRALSSIEAQQLYGAR